MANSSDWIAQLGAAAEGAQGGAPPPGWVAALTASPSHYPSGFQGGSPFCADAPDAHADPVVEPPQTAPPTESAQAPSCEEEEEDPQAEAYQRGFAEGHSEATRSGEATLLAEQERFRELRSAFRSLDAAAREVLAKDLQATVVALCEQVLGDYAMDTDALALRCEAAAKRLGAGPRDLTLQLHPETRARLSPDALADWTLADDASLAPGALRLASSDGAVRDGPQDWMRALTEALSA
ncbi:MAG: hypothetical protein AAGH57_09750 [Pseudomonadota bacterium]